jgi:multidrug efflux pump
LLGTFGIMYLLGYTLDNLSLMALTISTGFVVDDAIVVIENIARHLERGVHPFRAALIGSSEIGFTVLSMSISLVAVFIPILMMGGIVGRLFREFAVVLSLAIGVSLLVSLTTTPTMCAKFLTPPEEQRHGRLYMATERIFDWILRTYGRALNVVLAHPLLMLFIVFVTMGLNVYLFARTAKGFFPEQDTGRLTGAIQADQRTSFQAMSKYVQAFVHAVQSDPAITDVVAFTGGSSTNTGRLFASLKDIRQREGVEDVMARIRRKTAGIPGATLYLQPVQDIRVGGRSSNAQYQFTLQSDDLNSLNTWAPRMLERMRHTPGLLDVNSDQLNAGLETWVNIDRDTASRLGLSAQTIDDALYDAFGQRQVSTMYTELNQYHVVMEVAPRYWQSPDTLHLLYVTTPTTATTTPTQISPSGAGPSVRTTQSTAIADVLPQTGTAEGAGPVPSQAVAAESAPALAGSAALAGASGAGPVLPTAAPVMGLNQTVSASATAAPSNANTVPFQSFLKFQQRNTPLAVNHESQFPSVTLSFNLRPGFSLGEAVDAITSAETDIGIPANVQGRFSGTAEVFRSSLANEPVLIATALIAVYIVLGVLYESYIHPITILSTLPSAGVGAMLALLITHTELTVIATIGIILLIGIVKKNAIMMIDFALDAERRQGCTSREAIYQAALLRFRPITMTTMAALLGGLPLALGTGTGAELRRPLGITIVGGLIVSQMVTLFSTPVIYLYLDRFQIWIQRHRRRGTPAPPPIQEKTDF